MGDKSKSMKTIKGDLISMAFDGQFNIIAHGCNCQGMMGAGIALQIRQKIPGAAKADRDYKANMEKVFGYTHPFYMLGTMSKYIISPEEMLYNNSPQFMVANLYTQVIGGPDFKLEEGLIPALTKLNLIWRGKRIGFPMIGAGIGGGDWNEILPILTKYMKDCDVTIVEYELKQ